MLLFCILYSAADTHTIIDSINLMMIIHKQFHGLVMLLLTLKQLNSINL